MFRRIHPEPNPMSRLPHTHHVTLHPRDPGNDYCQEYVILWNCSLCRQCCIMHVRALSFYCCCCRSVNNQLLANKQHYSAATTIHWITHWLYLDFINFTQAQMLCKELRTCTQAHTALETFSVAVPSYKKRKINYNGICSLTTTSFECRIISFRFFFSLRLFPRTLNIPTAAMYCTVYRARTHISVWSG